MSAEAAKAHASMLRTIARPETAAGDALLAGADALERLAGVERDLKVAEKVAGDRGQQVDRALGREARLQRKLDDAEDDRAAAYLREAQLWDLLGRARGFLPDSVLADPESPIPDMELRQLRHDLAVQLEADPPEAGRKLWEELQRLRARLAALDDTPHHVIEVRADGWTLKHPLSCRPHLFDCPVNEACYGWDGPPAAIGRYVVDLDGDGELRIGEEVRADG